MGYDAAPLSELIDRFARLPGIGRKTAQRLAFYMLSQPVEEAEAFAGAVLQAKKSLRYCNLCQNFTDAETCAVCRNPARDTDVICVVEEPKDVVALERTNEYGGLYHVLHGVISPLNGITPDDIKLKELLVRVRAGGIAEVIMATNASVEGEATAMYVAHLLKPLGVKVTRLAYGLPVGGDLEYADEVTLARAMEGRNEL